MTREELSKEITENLKYHSEHPGEYEEERHRRHGLVKPNSFWMTDEELERFKCMTPEEKEEFKKGREK